MTLPALLVERARQAPDRTAYRHKRLGVWEAGTWAAYADDAAAAGLALAALGIGPGDRVAIAADNRPEWLVADLGIQGIGAVSVGLYPSSPAADVEQLLAHCGARIVVCEDEEQLDKVLQVRAALAQLTAAVVIDTRGVRDLHDPLVRTWAELLASGRALDQTSWRTGVEALDPDAPAALVYSSVTAGPPSGAELTSRELVAAGTAFRAAFPASPDDEVLSNLPLSHVAERVCSVVNALATGCIVNFGEGGESLAQDLREVQPTLLLARPSVWARMLGRSEKRMTDATFVKRSVYRWCTARGRGLAGRRAASAAKAADPAMRMLCWLLCFRQLRRKLGLGRVATAVSAPPLDARVAEWFAAIGVEVGDGHGEPAGTVADLLADVVPA